MYFKQLKHKGDNFTYIIADDSGNAVVIDPSYNADAIIRVAETNRLNIKYIINTHDHGDHVFGNREVKLSCHAEIIAHKLAKIEKDRIVEVLKTLPLHSKIVLCSAYYFKKTNQKLINTGDIYEVYRELCEVINLEPLTQRRVSSLINECYEGMIKVGNFRFSNKDEIIRIKNSQFKKVYKVKIIAEKLINIEKLKKAAQRLLDKPISQFTPSRVAQRRANINREKKVYKCDVESVHENMAILTVETDSGTYIKELITGDDGKTKPSISELIGVPCTVSELDVLEIKGE